MFTSIAIIGRPNVGKSTLFNKLTKSRKAIVSDYSGLTKDRNYGYVVFGDQKSLIIDTGGIAQDNSILKEDIAEQAWIAAEEASLIIFLIDGSENLIKEDLKAKISNYHNIKIIAVSKTFPIESIMPLIEYEHLDFGENKVQEAIDKWSDIKLNFPKIKLHLIGKLQTNKVKFAVKIFDYIHSVDSEKLAKKIADEETKINKKMIIL